MAARTDGLADPTELLIIGLDTDDGEDHPLWDDRIHLPVDNRLVANIRSLGVRQPVTIREESGKKFVIDGRQRVRCGRVAAEQLEAMGEARLKIPFWQVRESDDVVSGLIVSLNELRQNDDVLNKAFKVSRLLARLGSEEEVAMYCGKSITTIKNWLSLVEADPEVHKAIRGGAISASSGIEISFKPRDEQVAWLARYIKASTGSGPSPTPRAPKTSTNQKGVLRSDVRKVLKTKAAEQLSDSQQAVLKWFATGESNGKQWFDRFMEEASSELRGKKTAPTAGETVSALSTENLPPPPTGDE